MHYENLVCIHSGILLALKKYTIRKLTGKSMELGNIVKQEVAQTQEPNTVYPGVFMNPTFKSRCEYITWSNSRDQENKRGAMHCGRS